MPKLIHIGYPLGSYFIKSTAKTEDNKTVKDGGKIKSNWMRKIAGYDYTYMSILGPYLKTISIA